MKTVAEDRGTQSQAEECLEPPGAGRDRHLKADPDPQDLLEKMGFQVGQAPSGSQEGQGRGVWRDPLAP